MKLLLKNLPLLLLVQFTLVGATLHLSEVVGEAVCVPQLATDKTKISVWVKSSELAQSGSANERYITGNMTEAEFVNECKSISNFRTIFRNEIKNTHDLCTGIGDECVYSGSPGCGVDEYSDYSNCECEIDFNYCTETSRSREIEETTTSSKSGDRF